MAKAIMIQGTMSNAGKSLLCTGLCRIFKQDGYKVAPFKSQNMALNSYVTKEGLEMGRAQVTQAEAAGVEPDVRMNPILLKPMSNMTSQVIVNGEVRGNYDAQEYYRMRSSLLEDVATAYESLAAENDIIVLEGAGSPAEINLPADDFVNMGMAKIARAPVLLVGDIDRGGVFAQLYGTIALLPKDEQELVKATIINKFRGDIALLQNGRDMLLELTGKPVAGIVPYCCVDIDEEDSLAERLVRTRKGVFLEIAVIRLPHISNFTDFAALEATPGVGVRYVRRAEELLSPDMVILPGTKNTMDDLLWLRKSGMEEKIKSLHRANVPVFGICGGYQMLGREIRDEANVEGGGTVSGMGLLPTRTSFSDKKHRMQTRGTVLAVEGTLSTLSGIPVSGYEIHMGATELDCGARPFIRLENGRLDGCQQDDVCGTYLHGFFDDDGCRKAVLTGLAHRKGIDIALDAFSMNDYKNRQYDLLAQNMRDALDMDLIYRILEAGA